MSFVCGQCGSDCGSEKILRAHLMRAHGLTSNPRPHSLANLYEEFRGLEGRVVALEGRPQFSVEEALEWREYLAFARQDRARGVPGLDDVEDEDDEG